MSTFVYRLQLLLEQKEEAEKAAVKEQQRLEEERDAAALELKRLRQVHRDLIERREQARRGLLLKPSGDAPLTAHEVQRRSDFVKALGSQIDEANKRVFAQRIVVEQCDAKVAESKQRVADARREVEVLMKHREKQEERFLRNMQVKEDLELDEVGNVLYTTRRRSQ